MGVELAGPRCETDKLGHAPPIAQYIALISVDASSASTLLLLMVRADQGMTES